MTRIRSASYTDIGKVRKENEDRVLLDEDLLLYGVADGVGGLPGGAEAAQAAVDVVRREVRATPQERDLDLKAIVTAANDAVVGLGLRISPGLGIGSTLTLACIRGGRLRLAHVGDSRAFYFRHGDLVRLTEDHSVENEARRRRARGEVVYYSESQRGALTRCIGQPLPPEPDLIDLPLAAGDRYLFCTDGITRVVTEHELREIVEKAGSAAALVRNVVELALLRGGPDNASAVAAIVDEV
jgi:serine/threonine protein phosphatase PrpC